MIRQIDKTSEYLQELLTRDSRLSEMEEFARAHNVPILFGESANFLKSLVLLYKPTKILEVGTAIGYSGLIMLLNSAAKLTTIEIDEANFAQSKLNFAQFEMSNRVVQFFGDAGEILPLISGQFDFIFLDGPKSQYIEYLPHCDKLLKSGGVLLCDNVLFYGMVANPETATPNKKNIAKKLDSFLRLISDENKFVTSIVPIGDGISISIKR